MFRKALLILLSVVMVLVGVVSLAEAHPIHYVTEAGAGSGNGSSWANAHAGVQAALAVAEPGDEIWVAEGTYKPGVDRTDTFHLLDGVALYGGFVGDEDEREKRDWTFHETVLSGNIGMQHFSSDNSYHVVTGSGTDSTAVLDGFIVRYGYASSDLTYKGGGMYNESGSPTVAHCAFRYNYASHGGGMYNSNSSPTVADCSFDNEAGEGGGMYNESSSPTVTNCAFSGNEAGDGGGMYNYESDPAVTRCIFSDNRTYSSGGGMYNSWSSPPVANCTFSGNTASGSGGGIMNADSSPTVTNCTFSGNDAEDGGGMANYNSSPIVKNTIFGGNTPQDCGGDYSFVASEGYNLESGTSCGCTDTTDQQNTDPLLDSNLRDNGGPTWTHALLPGSRALDAIPSANDFNGAPPTDQRGFPRPYPTGGLADIGAVEMQLAYSRGDVNGDGAIDLLDVVLCAQIASGLVHGTAAQRAAADVDDDGDVDANDVSILSEYVLRIRPTLP